MNKRWLWLVVPALLAGAALLLWQRHAADQPLDKVGTVRIAASLTISPALVWVAQDRGFFTQAGLDATVSDCATGKACTEAMLKGEVDLAAAAEFLAARKSFENKELRILGSTAFVHTIKLLALKDRGIAGPAGLAGKRVGVKLGTNGEYFLARLLVLHHLDRGDITWVDMKPQDMLEAMNAGTVDAVLVWPPFTNRIRGQLGGRVVEFEGQPGQDYYYLVMGHRDWLAKHPRVAERVMLALKWAEAWVNSHPEEARTYMAGKFGLPLVDMADDLENTRFAVGLPQALLTALETESRWLESQGTAGSAVANSLDLIDFAPLSAVSPEAVTMIHDAERR